MTGTITKDVVKITRHCGGQGAPADCKQVYEATLSRASGIVGTWSGSFADASREKNRWRVAG